MSSFDKILDYLKNYSGRPLKIMEVCGTHTSAIIKSGIRELLSDKIKLVSGPGCPVCVTQQSYIDMLIKLSSKSNTVIVTYSDMLKVPGTTGSLSMAQADGSRIKMVYSPLDILPEAIENPDATYIIAAIGFETTAPVYCLMLDQIISKGIHNIQFLTSLKKIIPALDLLCADDIDAFIAPGHVTAIIGSNAYEGLSRKYKKPFTVTGFTSESILISLYNLVCMLECGRFGVDNIYKSVVTASGNVKAQDILNKYFVMGDAYWRGIGVILQSGLYLREDYREYDAGSFILSEPDEDTTCCSCSEVIRGKIQPTDCAFYGISCTPFNPLGPCMVSSEGACGVYYINKG